MTPPVKPVFQRTSRNHVPLLALLPLFFLAAAIVKKLLQNAEMYFRFIDVTTHMFRNHFSLESLLQILTGFTIWSFVV